MIPVCFKLNKFSLFDIYTVHGIQDYFQREQCTIINLDDSWLEWFLLQSNLSYQANLFAKEKWSDKTGGLLL